ncbi:MULTISPECIES: dephospho-CoA kinase [Bacillus]|uniref:dephospho-CoA kinase n=1 Tax=Bacillus TaxID=1386 RepID=UPI000BB7D870|nr:MULTISPECIES: dephospho-CoA kinase [Bacillus]
MAKIIGLTGGIASGKSTVANMMRNVGIPIVDADIVAREVVDIGKPAYRQIVEVFGKSILYEDGSINRPALGNIIFHQEERRKKLNEIVHPAVRTKMKEDAANYIKEGHPLVVMDIPLLFESKLTHLVEKTLLVYVDESTQLERLMERNLLSKEDAIARIKSQLPLKEKIKLADEVINNNGSIAETEAQLQDLLERLCK